MKKVKLTLVLLAIIALAVFALTACGNKSKCEHDYSYVTIKEPTCTEKGVESGVCSLCGDDTTRHIDSLGHDEVSHEAKAATCTENGYDAYATCSCCGYTTYNASSETYALGHAFEKGNCSRCGETQLDIELSDDESCYIVTGVGEFDGNELEIPANYKNKPVKEIAIGAFRECTSLESVVIPDSVISIGDGAFTRCSSLTSVKIGKGVTSIGTSAFYRCHSLTSITVDNNNSSYKSIDGNLYSKDGKILLQYAMGNTATSFTIPDGVTSIRYWAFAWCESLTSVVIPISVTSIDGDAFYYSYNLTIYCEAASQPSGWYSSWDSSWNPDNCPVVWGYTGE